MAKTFDLTKFKTGTAKKNQYQRQLQRLSEGGKSVDCIERAVREALKSLDGKGQKSFVIYGEPQSGKTEMMICLTAKLLDDGRPLIVHLLNDSVDLLMQNLGRFKTSGIAPSAQNYSEILDPSIDINKGQYVLFCKKNSADLKKLYNKIGAFKNITIVDDEADYASPNGKINVAEKTKINEWIEKLLSDSGDYIGVTATPARLDLNHTFDNDNSKWVHFPPHSQYTGQDIFFPFTEDDIDQNENRFRLTLLKDKVDEPRFARNALFSFLVNVSYLNLFNNNTENNYSFLIHTSGKKVDHKTDWGTMQEALASLVDRESKKFDTYAKDVWSIAHDRYTDVDPDDILSYILENISRNAVIVLNSDSDFRQNGLSATNPSALFTIVIGGNIVSRGVTFDNLLSMFFTRDVKHKIQQDTYIQRARMFGSRGKYLSFFELTIPENLYSDWHRCFVFHRLSLASIKAGKGSPVWLSDGRISAVASSSIDRSTVDIKRKEMAFSLFDYSDSIDDIISSNLNSKDKISALAKALGDDAFPDFLRTFMARFPSEKTAKVSIQKTAFVYPSMSEEERSAISRGKGMMGASQTGEIHSLKIFRNHEGRARLYYKFDGSIEFMKLSK